MFENKEKTPLDKIGEFKLIEHLTAGFENKNSSTKLGIGDDAAVLDVNGQIVTSTDFLVENVHFDIMYTPLMHLGYKAVVVNLSDICAMNAVPTQITVSLAVSSKYTLEAMEELYAGIKMACEKYRIDLIGGDTTAIPKGMVISVTSFGVADEGEIVKRSGAKPGDLLCVSGDLGGAYAGLQLLEREKRVFLDQPDMQPDLEGKDYIIGRQLRPEARVDVVDLLKKAGIKPTSMIDISDGLSSDVMQICQASSCGVKLYEEKFPIDPQTYETARELNMDPTLFVLSGGEDYELLFTIPQADYDKVKNDPDISVIGYVTEASEGKVIITKSGNQHDLVAQGWQAFQGD